MAYFSIKLNYLGAKFFHYPIIFNIKIKSYFLIFNIMSRINAFLHPDRHLPLPEGIILGKESSLVKAYFSGNEIETQEAFFLLLPINSRSVFLNKSGLIILPPFKICPSIGCSTKAEICLLFKSITTDLSTVSPTAKPTQRSQVYPDIFTSYTNSPQNHKILMNWELSIK